MEPIIIGLIGIVGIAVGIAAGFILKNVTSADKGKEAEIEAKDKIYQARMDIEKESQGKRSELMNLEKRLSQKENHLERKGEQLERRESELHRRGKENSGRGEMGGGR